MCPDDGPMIGAEAAGAIIPTNAGVMMQVFLDSLPPQFPTGCDLVMFRPGDLEPVGTFRVPLGYMVALIPPEVAAQMRPMIRAQAEAARLAAEKQARNGLGG